MRVIIAGGRDFNDKPLMLSSLQDFWKEFGNITEVVCGMASGADMLGLNCATDLKIPIKEFPADWGKYGKSAGPIRNEQMAMYADALIAFWDGKSKGTKNMIEAAQDRGLKILIQKY